MSFRPLKDLFDIGGKRIGRSRLGPSMEHVENLSNGAVLDELEWSVVYGDFLDHKDAQTTSTVGRTMRKLVDLARRVCLLGADINMATQVGR